MFPQIGVLLALGLGGLHGAAQQNPRPELHARREAPADLEITGTLRGLPSGESRFASREFLFSLPQVAVTIQRGKEFEQVSSRGLRITGVYLDVLRREVGAESAATTMAAICSDGYTSTFPSDYVRRHLPILVLSIEGMSPHEWAVKNHDYDADPYFIGYEKFVPSYQILAHTDQPQEPDGLTKVVIGTESQLLGGITPRELTGSTGASEMDGYRIARQNCFRCHNSGTFGGTKAGVSWGRIGSIAKNQPEYFAAWVHDPQAIRATSKMPPNKTYDRATLLVLQRYFAPFAAVEGH